eukprot:g28974.t1
MTLRYLRRYEVKNIKPGKMVNFEQRLQGGKQDGEVYGRHSELGTLTKYRKEIDSLVAWCKDDNLSLNVSKTKELVIDFRKQCGGHAPACINSAKMYVVKSFKFL